MPGVVGWWRLLCCCRSAVRSGPHGPFIWWLLGATHLKRTIYTFLFCLIVSSFSYFDWLCLHAWTGHLFSWTHSSEQAEVCSCHLFSTSFFSLQVSPFLSLAFYRLINLFVVTICIYIIYGYNSHIKLNYWTGYTMLVFPIWITISRSLPIEMYRFRIPNFVFLTGISISVPIFA